MEPIIQPLAVREQQAVSNLCDELEARVLRKLDISLRNKTCAESELLRYDNDEIVIKTICISATNEETKYLHRVPRTSLIVEGESARIST